MLTYGSTERTKDVDAFVAERNEVLDELEVWAGKNTVIAKREGYFSRSYRRSTPWRRACSIGHCRSKG